MQKIILSSAIEKYYLGGLVQSVKWNISKNTLYVDFITPNKDAVGKIKQPDIELDDCEIGIYDTSQLVKLIKIADKTVSLSLNRGKHVITELLISDNQYDSTFYLSDMLMIDPVPNIELPPSVSAVIEIDDEFMNKFITARKALNEATIFNVETQGDSVLFVLGDKNTLSHKVKISLPATITDEIPSIMSLPFNIDYLHEIFSANYGSKGTINIYSQGLLEINFVDEKTKGEATYFLVRLQER
jgi:hypothetical protein